MPIAECSWLQQQAYELHLNMYVDTRNQARPLGRAHSLLMPAVRNIITTHIPTPIVDTYTQQSLVVSLRRHVASLSLNIIPTCMNYSYRPSIC